LLRELVKTPKPCFSHDFEEVSVSPIDSVYWIEIGPLKIVLIFLMAK